jgi:uncharacterized phage-associated protein
MYKFTLFTLACMNFERIDSYELSQTILNKIGGVSHLKLQKLIYYIEAWHLAILDEPLINDEFEAWLHGPVIRSIYAKYVGNGFNMYDGLSFDKGQAEEHSAAIEAKLHADQNELISDVLAEYGDKSDYHLECLTHSEEPWIEARKGVAQGEASRNIISKETMKRFYAQNIGG